MINLKRNIVAIGALSLLTLCQNSWAQTAPDWTEVDLDGVSHNLYTDYLDEGNAVWLDFMATWCGPCWGFHQKGYFDEFYTAHGPDSLADAQLFMIESDPSTPPSLLSDSDYDWTEDTHITQL